MEKEKIENKEKHVLECTVAIKYLIQEGSQIRDDMSTLRHLLSQPAHAIKSEYKVLFKD